MTTRDIQSTVATSQHTVNYDLPLWDGNDITSWQGNLNDAFNKIDTAMYDNKTEMLGYQEIADELKKTNDSSMGVFDTLNEKIADMTIQIASMQNRIDSVAGGGTENAAAINTMRLELDALKAQCDTMQDDVGMVMDIIHGKLITLPNPITLTNINDASDTVRVSQLCLSSNIINMRIAIPGPQTITDMKSYDMTADDSANIGKLIGIDLDEIYSYSMSAGLTAQPNSRYSCSLVGSGNTRRFRFVVNAIDVTSETTVNAWTLIIHGRST